MLEKLPDVSGEALGALRAGLANTVFHAIDLRPGMGALTLDSLAVGEHGPIPGRYTADGDGLSPPLNGTGVHGLHPGARGAFNRRERAS